MTYDFATRLNRLGTRMKEVNDNFLLYSRTDENRHTTTLQVNNFTPVQFDMNELASFGIPLLQEKMQRFAFDAADIATLNPPKPVHGDRITWGTRIYEVVRVNEETYRYTTSSQTRLLVNAKQIGTTSMAQYT